MANNTLETFLDFLGVSVGTAAELSSLEPLNTEHVLNELAQASATALDLIPELPGFTPENLATAFVDLAAFMTNYIVLNDDLNTPGPDQALNVIADIGTQLGDAISFFGAIGLILGFPRANELKFSGGVLTAYGIVVDTAILAQHVDDSLTNNYMASEHQAISGGLALFAQYGPLPGPYVGAAGDAVVDDIGTTLSYASLTLSDYQTPDFSSDITTLQSGIATLTTDTVNLFDVSGASSGSALTVSGTGPSISFTDGLGDISATITNADDFGSGQSISLSDSGGSVPVTISGVATLANGGLASSSREVSASGSAAQDVVSTGGGETSPLATLGDNAVTAASSVPYYIGYNSAGEMSVEVPFTAPADTVSVIQTDDGAYDVESGDPQQVVDFAPGGLTGGTIDVSQDSNGTIDISLDISASATVELASDETVSGVSQDFTFTGANGTLRIDNGIGLIGTIFDFSSGDTIDLEGVTAAGTTFDTDRLFTVLETEGGGVGLQFDPNQNLAGMNLEAVPDESGGTRVIADSLVGLIGAAFNPATAGTFGSVDPATGAVDPYGVSFPGLLLLGSTDAAQSGDFYFETATPSDPAQTTLNTMDIQTGQVIDSVTTTVRNFAADNLTGKLVGLVGPSANPATAGTFGSIDPATGSASAFGAAFPGVNLVSGTEYAANGLFYFETAPPGNAGQRTLNVVDVTTGQLVSSVATSALNFAVDDLTGELVGLIGASSIPATAGTFGVIDRSTGGITQLGDSFPGVDLVSGTDAAANGLFYFETASPSNPNQRNLNTVDIRSGRLVSSVPTTGTNFAADRDVACFASGTRIATDHGEIAVDELTPGLFVRTVFSGLAPVRWIGYRHLDCSRHPNPRDVWPVRVSADAFGEHVPHRDLWLSPDHAVYTSGALIPVRYLLNHTTIEQVPRNEVTYFHVELDQHDVLLAEGLPAESYLDTGDRLKFANAGSPIAPHPDFSARAWEAMGCAPLIVSGGKLAAIRGTLEQRARCTKRIEAIPFHGRS